MDDAHFLSLCAVILFIFGSVIFAKYGDVDGPPVIASALICVGRVIYVVRRPQKASEPQMAHP